ncbi:MAG: class I SAM-dependent rRNA methyltransferase [Verrucomicrobiae bacterium]|nr:class I SAM-dependent rRNA methyltransferase [Verrucomicrobiae bacterium]
MNLSTVLLKPGEADRIAAGHPWVYTNSMLRLTGPAADGDWVQVKDHRQRLLGTGFYNSKSRIAVRLLDRDRVPGDREFFSQRIAAAAAVRRRWLPGATSHRWINAESDFLSGLIVDRYEDVLVVQISSLGMERRKDLICEVLREQFQPRAILERGDPAARRFDGLEGVQGVLWGEAPDRTEMGMNGLRWTVDFAEGHKTGHYLDQQVNYASVGALAAGASEVLDCFTYTGGFALHAAQAGARNVLALDQSEAAVAAGRAHAEANGLAKQVQFEAANVFDWLKERTAVGRGERVIPRFDLIVLDPPSFTRNRASVPDALRGYKEIHLRALRLLKPGGVLATFCCSHHVHRNLFEEVILAAAFDSRLTLRRVASYTQSPDHPVIPAIPETEYLKGFAYERVR